MTNTRTLEPVYQRSSCGVEWAEITFDFYARYAGADGFCYRILYPAADYEALQKELTHWKANHADLKERLHVATHRTDLPSDRLPLFDEMKADIAALQKENAELKEDLQFVERWASHHGTKPNVTAQEALSCIQHYPSIAAITKSYKDGVIPDTRNPYAEIEAQAKRITELEEKLKYRTNTAC